MNEISHKNFNNSIWVPRRGKISFLWALLGKKHTHTHTHTHTQTLNGLEKSK